ncbi:hypothetical protein LTR53_004050 [Teratosphaeriaceae sp. CCFEE 6253]|nr:hypothetical protein LTR53_004050 [Teratosphaeriaceae sp. CCFEE 6253]
MRPPRLSILALLLLTAYASPAAIPRQTLPNDARSIVALAKTFISLSDLDDGTAPNLNFSGHYTITQHSGYPVLRSTELLAKQAAFIYGPPVAGGPSYPTGALGLAKIAADLAAIEADLAPELVGALLDGVAAVAGAEKYNGLQTLDDYTKLYGNEWRTTLPGGLEAGILTNYTDDLLFSMERLSISPYSIRRLNPESDSLAFLLNDSTVRNVTGATLQQLFQAGRLFYTDYRDQSSLKPNPGAYSAACDAYFYIHESLGDFLPLAIRTNVGSNLIYTPADDHDDWLLAKMMYNANDFWFAQWNHLASTHEVVQIAYMAAIRTLSEEHPVMALLHRLMFEVFAIQPLAQTILFSPGSAVVLVFAYNGQSAQAYSDARYKTGGSGRFQANYFANDLRSRGLINSTYGPALKCFPFHEDASTIFSAIEDFMHAFVGSFYPSNSVIAADKELQAWAKEANGAAHVLDFPASISSASTLVDILTHMAHLASTSHHTVNPNELLSASSTLPFHPPALYKAISTSKGVSNVADYLPPLDKIIEQFTVGALFARPKFVGTNRTLLHMFDDVNLLSRMNPQTRAAAAMFKSSMQAFSSQVSARAFDQDGLSQGMPFIWQALDPNVVPYSITT